MIFPMRSLLFLLSVLIVNVVLPIEAQSGLSVVMGNKHYYIDTTQTGNFYDGVYFCAQYDMTLASIENKAEFNRLYTILKVNDILNKKYWLSGHNVGMNTVYSWLGTGKTVNYWGEGTAPASPQADRCLSLAANTLGFTESDCVPTTASTASFICEKPLEPSCGKYGQCRYTYSYSTN